MNKSITLRGLVLSRYKSVSDFASAIGWQRNKAARIINGSQEPDTEEMKQLAKLLDMSQSLFMNIFFGYEFTLCTDDSISA